jgi:hypothetical protein
VCVPIVSDLSLLLLKSFDVLVNRGGERAFRFGFCICSRDLAISCVMCNYLVCGRPREGRCVNSVSVYGTVMVVCIVLEGASTIKVWIWFDFSPFLETALTGHRKIYSDPVSI